MADSVVTFLLNNLSQLLVQKAKLVSGVEDKITSLCNELKFINVFLKNSEGKRNENEIVKEVVSQIRDVAHEAEDLVDTFIANVTIQKKRNIMWRLVHGKHHVLMLHDVAVKIEKIKGTIREIYDNKSKYGIEEGESARGDIEAVESLRKRRRDVAEEEEVVGFVHDSSVVIDQLMKKGSGRNVVSIIGMGGLGKTTLARKIYNNDKVKKMFPCRAWGYVSNDYRARELLLSLLHCLLPASEYTNLLKNIEAEAEKTTVKSNMLGKLQDVVTTEKAIKNKVRKCLNWKLQDVVSTEEALKNKVRKCLNGKKYLVVLDDIWKTEVWDEVQDAFPNDKYRGSRILLTSRIKEVAFYTSQTPPYYLPFLDEEESWELFSKKVFRGEECRSNLEPLGRKIAKSCDGLPLSIVVLGGLLANKEKSERVWSKIKGNVNWYLGQDKTKVSDILKLSYDNLPRRLKPCFLYFGIYPEDYEIPVRKLIQLWIAEGLIQETGTQDPEDVAEDYLDELVDRSLVQVASKRSDGGVKTCRVHDLLRDLCISESKDDKFLEVCVETNIQNLSNPRRLSLLCNTAFDKISSTLCKHSRIRSFFCFGQQSYSYAFVPYEWKGLFKKFKLARVLDFGQVHFSLIPSDLEKLIHLRYLKIETYRPHVIPACVCSLWNLETLEVRSSLDEMRRSGLGAPFIDDSPMRDFPSGMWKLKQLRHLNVAGPVMLPHFSGSSDDNHKTMWSLKTLSAVALDRQTMCLLCNGKFSEFKKMGLHQDKTMCNLQTLSAVALNSQTMSLLDNDRFPNLKKLGLFYNENNELSLEKLQSLHSLRNLHTLKVTGTSMLPSLANLFALNLTKITLVNFVFYRRDVDALGRLPNLQILKLSTNHYHSSGEFHCAAGSFPQLQVLHMVQLRVEMWTLNEGAMLRLRHLHIKGCISLTELPEELWSLNDLGEVKVLGPSKKLAVMLQDLEVKNGCKLIIDPPPTNAKPDFV